MRKISVAGYRIYEAADRGDSEKVESLIETLNEAHTYTGTTNRLKPISAKDLPDIQPPESLWAGLIYPGCITQLNAEPGAGKSTLLYNITALGALGKDFLGIPFSKPIKTLYIDLESPDWLKKQKIETICGELPDNFHLLSDFKLKRDKNDLIRLARAERYDLIGFDTQSKALDMEDENDNAEANRAAALLRKLAKETGAAILLIHHTKKGDGGKDVYRGRGASAMAGAVDIVAILETSDSDTLKLTVAKSRVPGVFQSITMKKLGGDKFEWVSLQGERELELIREAIAELGRDGTKVNQQALIKHFKGIIGEKRLRSMLRQGDGVLWETTPGERNETIYKIKNREDGVQDEREKIQNGNTATPSNGGFAVLPEVDNKAPNWEEQEEEFLSEEAEEI